MLYEDVKKLSLLYWECQVVKKEYIYLNNCKDIYQKFNLTNFRVLSKLLKTHKLGKSIGFCQWCKEEFFVYSRSALIKFNKENIFPCLHLGFCKMCKQIPVTELSPGLFCRECYSLKINEINQEHEEKEALFNISDLSPIELKALSYLHENPDCLFVKNKWNDDVFSLNQLSYALKCSLSKANEIYSKLKEKYALIIRINENGRNIYYGVNNINKIPKFSQDISYQIIPSSLAQKTYFELLKHYPYVFPEVVFSSFIPFDSIKSQLGENERRWFFTKRLDFLCCDEEFIAMAAIEYNGRHHFSPSSTTHETRKFKRNLCELIGLPFIELNSQKQILTKINDLVKISFRN